jgi:hypothetical protein
MSKKRVRLATHVMSHSVAAGIYMQVATNQVSDGAIGTAKFLDKMDTVFDLWNSRNLVGDRPARCAVTKRNDNNTVTGRGVFVRPWG